MKIAIASDHGGFAAKQAMIEYYADEGIELKDLGAHCEESCDYPDIAEIMVKELGSAKSELGILICGTGIGISIAANRHRGIRAALLYNEESAKMAKQHNNANIAVFGGRTQSVEEMIRFFDIFLNTQFEGGRHQRRIDKLDR